MKTSELLETALDWAVAKAEGLVRGDALDIGFIKERGYTPSMDWAQGGPIIERYTIDVVFKAGSGEGFWWLAYRPEARGVRSSVTSTGPTPLIAAMRCYVASELGDEIEIPEDLK